MRSIPHLYSLRGLSFVLVAVLVFSATERAFSQGQGHRQGRTLTVEPVEAIAPGGRAALFVGVNRFSEDASIAPLRFAVNDAVALAHLVVQELKLVAPENAMLVLAGEPTTAELRRQLTALHRAGLIVRDDASYTTIRDGLQYAARRGREFLLVSFSSHGFTDGAGTPFIMPEDAVKRYASQRALRLRDIEAEMAVHDVTRSLVLVDACRNRFIEGARSASAVTPRWREVLSSIEGGAVLQSASDAEVSWEDEALGHGVFMYHVLEGLRGGAEADASGFVRVGELMEYVSTSVERYGLTRTGVEVQRPWYRGPESVRRIPLAVRWGTEVAQRPTARRTPGEVYAIARALYDAEDYAGALPMLREAAEGGYAAAQHLMGVLYDEGYGVAEDDAEAVRWYQRAANQGHAWGQYRLGRMYMYGHGVEANDREAV
ncbi:MAG: caspase family protein, partial [Bacteroidota bacterium]